MENKYIENDVKKGILYDWNFIKKEYKKLDCPKTVYNPCALPIGENAYNILLSERSTGKTTNLLLLGMIMNREYGTIIQYIRSTESMIMNKVIQEIFSTIREYGYIDKITKGKYNDVEYRARKWTYILKDDNGDILDRAPTHFMYCLSIDKSETYKSGYNAPLGDFIIFDEFIGKYYRFNEFVYFMDLLKTIIRDRQSAIIFMLANTIDRHSEYFSEFEIYETIQLMNVGDTETVTTSLGTKIYIEMIADKKKMKEKLNINRRFFGFNNTKLNSIIGGEWATNNYPHIGKNYKLAFRGVYVEYHDKLLAIDVVVYDDIGVCLNVHKATKTYDDSVIYSLSEPKDYRYRYHIGNGDMLDRYIWGKVKEHKVRFQNNACGTIFFNHYTQKIPKNAY